MSNNGNGTPTNGTANRILWFLLTGITGIALATISSWAITVNSRLDRLAERQALADQAVISINTKLDVFIQILTADKPHIKVSPPIN